MLAMIQASAVPGLQRSPLQSPLGHSLDAAFVWGPDRGKSGLGPANRDKEAQL